MEGFFMKRKNNRLHCALIALSTIALSSGSVQAADFGQLAQMVGNQAALAAPYLTNLGFLAMLAQYFGGAQSAAPAAIDPDIFIDSRDAASVTQLPDASDTLVAPQEQMNLLNGIGFEALKLAITTGNTGPLQELLEQGADV